MARKWFQSGFRDRGYEEWPNGKPTFGPTLGPTGGQRQKASFFLSTHSLATMISFRGFGPEKPVPIVTQERNFCGGLNSLSLARQGEPLSMLTGRTVWQRLWRQVDLSYRGASPLQPEGGRALP